MKIQEKINRIIGENIFMMRRKKNWLQIDLAKEVGVSRTSIANIESGKHSLTIETLYDFMKAFNVTYDKILPTQKQLDDYGKPF